MSLWAAVMIAAGYIAVVLGAVWAVKAGMRRREAAREARHVAIAPDAVKRRVNSVDFRPDGTVLIELECGHAIVWQLAPPAFHDCLHCTHEVAELRKLAGIK